MSCESVGPGWLSKCEIDIFSSGKFQTLSLTHISQLNEFMFLKIENFKLVFLKTSSISFWCPESFAWHLEAFEG